MAEERDPWAPPPPMTPNELELRLGGIEDKLALATHRAFVAEFLLFNFIRQLHVEATLDCPQLIAHLQVLAAQLVDPAERKAAADSLRELVALLARAQPRQP